MKTIRTRFVIPLLIMSILPMVIMSLFFKSTSYRDFLQSTENYIDKNTTLYGKLMTIGANSNNLKILTFGQQPEFKELLFLDLTSNSTANTVSQLWGALKLKDFPLNNNMDFADNIYAVTLDQKIVYSYDSNTSLVGTSIDTLLPKNHILIKGQGEEENARLFDYYIDKERKNHFVKCYIRNESTSNNMGYIYVGINESYFYNILTYDDTEETPNILFGLGDDNFFNLMVTDDHIEKLAKMKTINKEVAEFYKNPESTSFTTIENIDGADYIISLYKLPQIQAMYLSVNSQYELYESQSLSDFVFYLLVVIVAAIAVVLALIISGHLSNPIKELEKTMHKVKDGDLSVRSEYCNQDEIGYVCNVLNIMLANIEHNYLELESKHKELTESRDALEMNERRQRLILESASEVIWEWNTVTKEFITSDKWEKLIGMTAPKTFTWDDLMELLHPEFIEQHRERFDELLRDPAGYIKERITQTDLMIIHETGYKWIEVRFISKNFGHGEDAPLELIGSLTDITHTVLTNEKLQHMAYHDNLTGLYNSRRLYEAFEENVNDKRLRFDKKAIVMFDLDHFKRVNDTQGHNAGDVLIKQAAVWASQVFNEGEYVCRLGGDEFVIFCPKIESLDHLKDKAERLRALIAQDVVVNGDVIVNVTSSIGIAVYPEDGRDYKTLLKHADIAMYKSKEHGRDQVTMFDSTIASELNYNTSVLECLKSAIDNEEMQVYFQPQVDLRTGKITGFEALLRLFSEKLGCVEPEQFLGIADENGLMKQIGMWCLEQVCRTIAKYEKLGLDFDAVSINISVTQLSNETFLEDMRSILDQTKITPSKLQIEVTETQLIGSKFNAAKVIEKIEQMGVRIILDDFASGQSSLSYLRRLNIHSLKIDKQFIQGICADEKDNKIAGMIIDLAHSLGLKVVAEGVEYKHQLNRLAELGCDRLQGYIYSKAVPEIEARLMLKKQMAEESPILDV